ncbi:MAG: LysM peptidoglycan-binding domain-containing protein [Actinomycetota bacterium]
MAIRHQELQPLQPVEAVVLRFPERRASERRARMLVRRRRSVVLAAALAAAVLLGNGALGSETASPPSAPRAVIVRSGETLWDLAERHAPRGGDPRAYVDALEALNGIHGALAPGSRIRLPR